MAGSGVFSHLGSAGDQFWDRMASAGYRMRTSGENIAAGQRAPWEVMKAWRASPAHYAILTNPAVPARGLRHGPVVHGQLPDLLGPGLRRRRPLLSRRDGDLSR